VLRPPMAEEHPTRYNDEGWLESAEQLFEFMAMPQPGHARLYAYSAFLQAAPGEFYEHHPREWQAIVLAALGDGAGYEQLAQDARLRRRH